MKTRTFIFLTVLTLFYSVNSKAQRFHKSSHKKNCNCASKPILTKIISCDTLTFKNGYNKLYRQFNCDSSWLTFESVDGVKIIMETMHKRSMEFTGRLGYRFIKEYKKSLLFQNRLYSGGGFPENYELISKENGRIIQKFGTTITYYSDKDSNNYILYLTSLDTLTYYDIENQTKINFSIPKGILAYTIRNSSEPFAVNLFEMPKEQGKILTVAYKYIDKKSPKLWKKDSVIIDLSKRYKHK